MRKKTKIRIGIILGIVFFLSLVSQWTKFPWLFYHKPAFTGQVIDIDTKQPIAGAVVEAFYYSGPLIGGPGGGSPAIFKIRETLTDQEGKYVITPYTTLISPFGFGYIVKFLVYKPGYADSGAVEEQFSKTGWKHIEEYNWQSNPAKKIKFHDGVFELPRLEKREDRERSIPAREGDFLKQQKLLTRAINEEHRNLGYPPIPEP